MVKQAVLLTGGLAKRLNPITSVTNKHLLPVYDKPMIFHGLELLKNLGIEEVTIVLGGNSVGDIVNLIQDGSEFGLHISYVYQKHPHGIAHAISLTKKHITQDHFLVLLGDNLFFGNIDNLSNSIKKTTSDSLIFLVQTQYPENYGQPDFDANSKLIGFIEKSKNPKHNFIVTGLYYLPYFVFDLIQTQKPSKRGEYEITDTLMQLLPNVEMVQYDGFWSDCGTPEGLVDASKERRHHVKIN